MAKRTLTIIGYGVTGLLLAVTLTLGAYALAGRDLGNPIDVRGIRSGPLTPPTPATANHGDRSPKHDHGGGNGTGGNGTTGGNSSEDRGVSPSPSASPTTSGPEPADDHGGGDSGSSGDD